MSLATGSVTAATWAARRSHDWPAGDPEAIELAPIDKVTWTPDHLHATITFAGAAEPTSPDDHNCTGDYRLRVRRDGDTLVIGVEELAFYWPPPPLGCHWLGHWRTLPLDLDEPFTGPVVDATNGLVVGAPLPGKGEPKPTD